MLWPRIIVGTLLLCAAGGGATGPADCDLAVVGAGVGGAYSALRAAATGRRVCVFERAGRPGGRIHSLRGQGPQGDLVVEAGAYRFAKEPIVEQFGNITMKLDTPLTAAIVKELGLPTGRYNLDDEAWDHGLFKIVDEQGQNAGYLTLVEKLLELAVSHGASVRYSTAVVGLAAEPCCTVRLAGGEAVTADAVMLNLPKAPVIELLRNSGGAIASFYPKPLYNPVTQPIVKLYIHYDDAWWINDLGLTTGAFHNSAPPMEAVPYGTSAVEEPAPVSGAYHDGHVKCDQPDGRCRGFLQVYYGGNTPQIPGSMVSAELFYSSFVDSISNDSVVQVGREQAHHVAMLDLIHEALLGLHGEALDNAGARARVAAMRPTGAVLSIWRTGVEGIQGGCHQEKLLPNGTARVPGALAREAVQPFPQWPIYVANEAFGPGGCWAEASLTMAEMAMRRILGPNISEVPLRGGAGGRWPPKALQGDLLATAAVAGRLHTDPSLLGLPLARGKRGAEASQPLGMPQRSALAALVV